eukprot:g740.t1
MEREKSPSSELLPNFLTDASRSGPRASKSNSKSNSTSFEATVSLHQASSDLSSSTSKRTDGTSHKEQYAQQGKSVEIEMVPEAKEHESSEE